MKRSLFSSLVRLASAVFACATSPLVQAATNLATLPSRFLPTIAKIDRQRAAQTAYSLHDQRPTASTCLPANQLAHSHSTVFRRIAGCRPYGSFATGLAFVA